MAKKDESMQNADAPVLIYTTFPTLEDAKRAGEALVKGGFAACVNMFPGMISIYEWQGKLEEGQEVAAIVKTRAALAEAAMEEIRRCHPYEVPALLVLPTQGGSADYCDWIARQTGKSSR
jgi:periplasmic divalent cation tolerance protein